MQSRAFNTISIDEKNNICTKSSTNTKKLQDEVGYYLNLPKRVSAFFPQFIDHKKDFTAYDIEYIPYHSLQSLILSKKISASEAKYLFEQLMQMLGEMHAFKPQSKPLSGAEIAHFYIHKTSERIKELNKYVHFQQLLLKPYLSINGKKYKNFFMIEKDFEALIHKFTKKYHTNSLIHGDFCFSNILYCPSEKIIKLIDPRGSFTAKGIYGHDFYDYAKLMHCLHSRYDFVVNDLFTFKESREEYFFYEIPSSPILEDLEELFNNILVDKAIPHSFIYLIEASLFLSMAALHYENTQRQIVFYLMGIVILNQVIEGKYAHMY